MELFWSAFFPHFYAFRLNTERYFISLRILSKCGNMREKCGPEPLRIWSLFAQCIRLIIMKIETEMKNRLHRYDVNRPKSWHEHKYSRYKKYLRMMILPCTKQHLSNIWSSIHEKFKRNYGWAEKKCYLLW